MSAFVGSPSRGHLWFAIGAGEVIDGCSQRSEAKTLRKRLLAGPTVDVYVGAEKRHWSLHRNLLCHHSSWFEPELVGHEGPRAQEYGEDHKLELLDDDPRGFELLVKYLYQGSLEDMQEMTDEEKYDHAIACHKLHLLCDKFAMVQLKNIAMDLLRQGLNEAQLVPDPTEINEIYRASPVNSPCRRLMTKIAARQIMDPEVDKDAETYRKCFEDNPDFAVEMVNAIRYSSGGMLFADPTRGDLCDYHDHSDGQNCHATRNRKGETEP
jgi:Fe-S cluster assembly iron-binding protein IscA